MPSHQKTWRKPLVPVLFASLFAIPLFAQRGEIFSDRDTSRTTHQLYNILMAHREVEYFGIPAYFNSSKFGLTHDSVYSKHSGPFLEANLAPYYVVFKGRDLQHELLKRLCIAFEPQFTFRIYLTKSQSYPVRPPNFQPKFYFNYFIHKNLDSLTTRFSHLTLTVAHLSDGQPNKFFLDPVNKIVNLRSGNFSTNYLRLGYTFSQYLNPKTSTEDPDGWLSNIFWSASLAYQREMSFGKLLAFEKGQEEAGYGYNRLVSRLQFRSGNFLGVKALFSRYSQPAVYQAVEVPIIEQDTTVLHGLDSVKMYFIRPGIIVRKVDEMKRYHPRGYWNWMARLDHALVLDKKAVNRNGLDFIFELRNLNWRSFSFVAKCSWGRDYMNLRFEDNIQSYQLGISYNMDRYKVPYTKYLNAFNKGDVVTRDFERDAMLNQFKQRLPQIDDFQQPDTARVLYNAILEPRPVPPATVDLQGNAFTRPPCYRMENGKWKIVTTEAEKLKRIKKIGWYEAETFRYGGE